MKYLILLLLLTMSCTDKKQTPEPIVASYGVEPELFWLEEYSRDNIIIEESTYSAIYYEPISNQYYFATIEKTNNISYNTNNIIDEENYIDYKMFQAKTSFFYVGSTDLTNRIYIDNDKNLYIKKLKLINDTQYYDYEDQKQTLPSPVYPKASHYDGDGGDIHRLIFYTNTNTDFIFVRSLAQEPSLPYSPYSKGELLPSPYGN